MLVLSASKYRVKYAQLQFSAFLSFLQGQSAFLFIYGDKDFPCVLWQPFHLDSVLVCLLCFNWWPVCYSDHAITHGLLSIPAPACNRNIPFITHGSSSFFCRYDTHVSDFSWTVEPLNCLFAIYWDLWDRRCSQRLKVSSIALKIITVLRKFIVQILMSAEVLE